MTGPASKKPKSPHRSSNPNLPRTIGKRLRRSILSFQFALQRRPPKAVLFLSVVAIFLVGIVFQVTFWGFVVNKFTGSNAILEFAYNHKPDSTFSEDSCTHKYDQAWAVMRDDGTAAAKKNIVEIAYFVQVGSDAVALLPRLFTRIHHPRNVYIIHIDTKVDKRLRQGIQDLIAHSPLYSKNMYMLKSEMVTYKAISMVTNTIAAMTLALEKHTTWDYFINLSGADYPLVSPEDQARLLTRPRVPIGRLNFVSFFPRKEWKPYSFRVRNMHWDPAVVGFQSSKSRLRLLRGQKTNPLEPHRAYIFTKAEAWMILSRPFVQFVVRSGFAKRMLVNHVHVLSVPEHYFTDILYNHPFWNQTIVPDGFRRVVWYLKNRRSGQHPYVLDRGSTPFAFWEYIAETRSLFARKFSKPNCALMDRVDAQMSGHGLNASDPKLDAFMLDRRTFYGRIVEHFDQLTKKTLAVQGYSYPNTAYPSI